MLDYVRRELGDEAELLHDVHQRLTVTQAADLARRVEPYRLFFLEDPFGPEFVGGLAQLRAVTTTPIAMGELMVNIHECLPMIANRWIDYLRCDLGHIGGITAARKLAALCEPFNIRTAWHGPPDLAPIGHAANVHLDLATSNFGIQEWQPYAAEPSHKHHAAMREVFPGGVIEREGHLDLPDTPGLGIEVDMDAAKKHAYCRAYLPTVRRADGSVHAW
jgi:mannonate dehydratase